MRTEATLTNAENNEKKLLPCPFCGQRAEIDDENGVILCQGCGFGWYISYETTAQSIASWNRRVNPVADELRIKLCEARMALKNLKSALCERACVDASVGSHSSACNIALRIVDDALRRTATNDGRPVPPKNRIVKEGRMTDS